MKINYKYFLTGMIVALGPTFMWTEQKLNTSYKVLGAHTVYVSSLDTDYRKYDDFLEISAESSIGNISQDEEQVIPTSTPIPAPTSKPIVQVAAQEIVNNPVETQKPAQQVAPSDYDAVIDKYAAEYGANPNMMKKIAKCESGFNPEAISPSGAYHGMYQFVASTWVSNREEMGLDSNPELRRNAEEAIKTAAFKMGRDGYGAWPHCSKI